MAGRGNAVSSHLRKTPKTEDSPWGVAREMRSQTRSSKRGGKDVETSQRSRVLRSGSLSSGGWFVFIAGTAGGRVACHLLRSNSYFVSYPPYFLAQQGWVQPGSQSLPDFPSGATSNCGCDSRNGFRPV